MNLIKSIFALSLIGLSAQICAQPITIQCSDTMVVYDEQALNVLHSEAIEDLRYWDGMDGSILQDNVKLPIDSKGLAFMITLANKTDAQIFSFIDSLDEQTFRLVSFYTQLIKEERISNLLKYKMLKNPKLQQLAEFPDDRMKNFVTHKYHMGWNYALGCYETLLIRYLDQESFVLRKDLTTDSIYAFYALLVLIDFYQETLKKPLPLDTDHLKNLFYKQPAYIQQKLLNKKLVTLP